jgi:hypothetical protein
MRMRMRTIFVGLRLGVSEQMYTLQAVTVWWF